VHARDPPPALRPWSGRQGKTCFALLLAPNPWAQRSAWWNPLAQRSAWWVHLSGTLGRRCRLDPSLPQRDWYCIAEQPAPAPRRVHSKGCSALRIALVTVPRVGRSCEHFPDEFGLHMLRPCPNSLTQRPSRERTQLTGNAPRNVATARRNQITCSSNGAVSCFLSLSLSLARSLSPALPNRSNLSVGASTSGGRRGAWRGGVAGL